MHPLLEKLLASGPVVTDGAWGTELQKQGLQPGEFPDASNLTHPERVTQVAQAYVAAGSQVILTNTFGANRIRLAEAGLADQVVALNTAGVKISRQAAKGRAAVFASIGPSGKMVASGEVTVDQLRAAFAEQAQALADAGAEALIIETMSELDEAGAALDAARATGLPVIACMAFDSGQNQDRTMMGVTPEQAATALAQGGADVIGANCGRGIEGFAPICRRLKSAATRPIWIKANAGQPELADGRVVYRTTPGQFAAHIPELVSAGASFVGGCCGTTPEFIRAMISQLRPAGS